MVAMKRATDSLFQRYSKSIKPKDCFALVDGNKIPQSMCVETDCVVKGDSLMYSIAAASIIAKVTRDRIMMELDTKYPLYDLAQNKGYPTSQHRMALWTHGPSDIHRYSYRPVYESAQKHNLPMPNTYLHPHGATEDVNPVTPPAESSSKKKTKKNSIELSATIEEVHSVRGNKKNKIDQSVVSDVPNSEGKKNIPPLKKRQKVTKSQELPIETIVEPVTAKKIKSAPSSDITVESGKRSRVGRSATKK